MGADDVSWRFHPMKERPAVAAASLAVAIACSLGAVRYVGSLLFSLPIVTLFLYSLRSFFLPTDYRLTNEGVTVATPLGTTTTPWSRFGGYRTAPRAVVLTRLARPSLLDKLRAVELHFDEGERERILDYVKRRLDQ